MNKQLYLIDYENAHWCGGQLNVCVWAHDVDEAELLAEYHMVEEQNDLFSDEDGNGYEDESPVTVNSVVAFGPGHKEWEFFQHPSQSIFYPVIGESS